MSYPRLVAITGLAGSGKSTAASYLAASFGYKRTRFAAPLKNMLRTLFIGAGLSAEEAERRVEGDLKEVPDELLCGRTPRHAMQTLGTEWRDMIGRNLWTGLWQADASTGLCSVEDCRFEHEYHAVKEMGGIVVQIERGGGLPSAHVSERGLPSECTPDWIIHNEGSITDLHIQVRKMLYVFSGAES